MKKLLHFIVLLIVAQAAHAQVFTGLQHPESITGNTLFLYISDIGKELTPTAKDGDGAIVKADLNGNIIDRNIAKFPLHAPKGAAIVKGNLWIADIDCIKGLALGLGALIDSINFGKRVGATFLNDVVRRNDTSVFVTATDQGVIYELSLRKSKNIKALPIPVIAGINGIDYDPTTQRLAVNAMGNGEQKGGLYILYLQHQPIKIDTIPHVNGIFDGMQWVDAQHVLLSDWVDFSAPSGRLLKVNIQSGEAKVLKENDLPGPADIYYDKKNAQLWVPLMVTGHILKFNAGAPTNNIQQKQKE
ncbi:hypothetical protein [Chitinophaga skermanii]|nr:hypothetical protein [Chitinophaga skermanii]